MRQSDLVLVKFWVTHIEYFKLATTVALIIGITYGNLLLYHEISEGSMENKISTREYNNRAFYDCFNNPFPADCGSTYFEYTSHYH